MKFAEFSYERPDLQAAMAQLDVPSCRLKKSQSGSGASLPSAISAIR